MKRGLCYVLVVFVSMSLIFNIAALTIFGNSAQAIEAKLCQGEYIVCPDQSQGLKCYEVEELQNGDFNCLGCPWNTCDDTQSRPSTLVFQCCLRSPLRKYPLLSLVGPRPFTSAVMEDSGGYV